MHGPKLKASEAASNLLCVRYLGVDSFAHGDTSVWGCYDEHYKCALCNDASTIVKPFVSRNEHYSSVIGVQSIVPLEEETSTANLPGRQ